MKTSIGRLMLAALLFSMAFTPAEAVPPKDGRYKGTLTLRVVADGTKTEVKKVFPIAGVLTGGTLVAMMTEIPDIPLYFTGPVFNMTVGDGTVSMLPNNNALSLPLGDVKTTAGALKGSTDFGFAATPGGNFVAVKRYLALSMTRVGN